MWRALRGFSKEHCRVPSAGPCLLTLPVPAGTHHHKPWGSSPSIFFDSSAFPSFGAVSCSAPLGGPYLVYAGHRLVPQVLLGF
ncbi:hypothetical protein VTJ04DRAFT_10072 [Mycothermus thermophilus]|uniref:uncharacterized protein n=1 Tax=Humicola insolens TaxID=85995 RepID=UPI00374455CE